MKNKNSNNPTPKNKIHIKINIPNNNYDYSADTDEFATEKPSNEAIGKINTIQIKHNNITQIDKTAVIHERNIQGIHINTEGQGVNSRNINQLSNLNTQPIPKPGYRVHNNCITEPDEFLAHGGSFYNRKNEFTNSFQQNYSGSSQNMPFQAIQSGNTPRKYPQLMNTPRMCHCGLVNCNGVHGTTPTMPSFPMIINRASMISMSSHYSSSNKKNPNHFDPENSADIIEGNSTNEE
jgi:hypothetical protein